jgi:tRNA (cytidine/uridine-2'-O-)-methyltransferase
MALAVSLIEPQIPPNAGSIARICAATGASLHLIQPLGFSLDDSRFKRGGLDYWESVDLWVHPHWRAFRHAVAPERCLYFSTHGTNSYLNAPYAPNSVLVFGSETLGMPQRILEKHPERIFRIPMDGAVRSLNLAVATGIVLYEAIRQLGIALDGVPAAVRTDALENTLDQNGTGR